MGAATRIGLILLVLGVGGFLLADTVVQEGSSSAGQLERGISETEQSQFETYALVRIVSGVVAAAGGGLVVIGSVSSGRSRSSSSSGISDQGRSVLTVPPGDYRVVKFDIGKPHILDYTMEVLDGPSVNVIVTDQSELDTFKQSPHIGWIEDASIIDADGATKTSQLGPRDYAFIIDNTGRSHGQSPASTAKVDLTYRLTEAS